MYLELYLNNSVYFSYQQLFPCFNIRKINLANGEADNYIRIMQCKQRGN